MKMLQPPTTPIEPLTPRQVFETVKQHLLAQNAKSVARAPGVGCLYRGPRGMKCAAGALIRDEFYDPSMEGCMVRSEKVRNALRCSGVMDDSIDMVADLQRVHDLVSVGSWPAELDVIEISRLGGCGMKDQP